MDEYKRLTMEQGFHVYAWQRMLFDLTGTELIIFAIVYSYTQGGKSVGGTRFFMEWTGAGRSTVIRALDALEEAGLIKAKETANGQLKKYTISELAKQKIEAAETQQNQFQNDTSIKMKRVSKSDGYQYQNETGGCQNETGTSIKMTPATKQERKQEIKEISKHTYTPPMKDNAARELEARAMEPRGDVCMGKDFEVPTLDEVRATLDQFPVKPIAWEIDDCARCFMDKMDAQGWRVRDWVARLRTYAGNWVQNHSRSYTGNYRPQKPLHETVDSPARIQREEDIPW